MLESRVRNPFRPVAHAPIVITTLSARTAPCGVRTMGRPSPSISTIGVASWTRTPRARALERLPVCAALVGVRLQHRDALVMEPGVHSMRLAPGTHLRHLVGERLRVPDARLLSVKAAEAIEV